MTPSRIPWIPLLILAVAPSSARAQTWAEVAVSGGPTLFLSDLMDPSQGPAYHNDDALALAARVGVGGPRFGLELAVTRIATRVRQGPNASGDLEQTVLAAAVEGIAALPGRTIEPFVALGLGDKHYLEPGPERGGPRGYEAASYLLLSAGGGVRVHIPRSVLLRVDARDLISSFHTSQRDGPRAIPWTQHDLVLTVGIGYRFDLR